MIALRYAIPPFINIILTVRMFDICTYTNEIIEMHRLIECGEMSNAMMLVCAHYMLMVCCCFFFVVCITCTSIIIGDLVSECETTHLGRVNGAFVSEMLFNYFMWTHEFAWNPNREEKNTTKLLICYIFFLSGFGFS